MSLSRELRSLKLRALTEAEGYADVDALLEAAVLDSASPGICINEGCDHTTDTEPDQDKGWCDSCGTKTVQSALILAELI